MMDSIKEWWGALMAAGGLGVWLVRLESRMNSVSDATLREIARIDREMELSRSSTLTARKEQNEMLREMRADIKRLLERDRD